jgi:aryl-alcohol dehydrogenase-like predicted oxidoreductase
MMGETLSHFIQRLRVERAATMLIHNPKKPITQIAFACGFSGSAAFARSFREAFGMSASRWRSGGYRDDRRLGEANRNLVQTGRKDRKDFNVQPDYGEAEGYLAPVLRERRERIFVVTKTWEQTRAGALGSVRRSAHRLDVEYVDAVLLNNIGTLDLHLLLGPEGSLAGLRDAQRSGLVRYIGLSGHMGRNRFAEALETGEFDIAMPAINFVDRHTYNFEDTLLPLTSRHDVGVAAMKVLGGAVDWDYSTRAQRALLLGDDYEKAIHYALGLNGVSCAVLGCKSVDEVNQAARAVRRYRPMPEDELDRLLEHGKDLAERWGPHFGPVDVPT